MDNPIMKPQGRVRPIFAYIKDSIKFYDLEKPLVAQIIFLLQLGILFGGYWFARPYTQEFSILFEQVSVNFQEQWGKAFDITFLNSELYYRMVDSMMTLLLIFLTIKVLSFLITLFYGTYYHFSLTQPSMKGSQRFLLFLRRLPKLIFFNILFYIAYFFVAMVLILASGFITLMVPIFSVFTLLLPFTLFGMGALFIFKDLLIIEFDLGILKNFKKSWEITKGCRKNVIVNGLWPLFLGGLISLFAIDVGHPLLALFISAFFEVIVILVTQRLTVLMFADAASLERHDRPKESGKHNQPAK